MKVEKVIILKKKDKNYYFESCDRPKLLINTFRSWSACQYIFSLLRIDYKYLDEPCLRIIRGSAEETLIIEAEGELIDYLKARLFKPGSLTKKNEEDINKWLIDNNITENDGLSETEVCLIKCLHLLLLTQLIKHIKLVSVFLENIYR